MSTELQFVNGADDRIDLRRLVSEAWGSRVIILLVTLICTVLGAGIGLLGHKEYRAEILMSEAELSGGSGGGLGALTSQYGALASLAGISLPGSGSKGEALAVLQSRLITEFYIRSNNLLPVLYADKWDGAAGRWKAMEPQKVPTLWKATQYFDKKIRDIRQDKQTTLITMRITWRDPAVAAKWANDLVRDTNKYMRDKAIAQSERNIDYLNDQAAKTGVVEVKSAIYQILKQEINKEMIARGSEEYALKVIDPAQAPEVPSSASVVSLAAAGFLVGLLISGLIVFSRWYAA